MTETLHHMKYNVRATKEMRRLWVCVLKSRANYDRAMVTYAATYDFGGADGLSRLFLWLALLDIPL